jgi:hypothetical protein
MTIKPTGGIPMNAVLNKLKTMKRKTAMSQKGRERIGMEDQD